PSSQLAYGPSQPELGRAAPTRAPMAPAHDAAPEARTTRPDIRRASQDVSTVTAACRCAWSGNASRDANAALAPDACNLHLPGRCGCSPLQSLPGILVSLTGHLPQRLRARLLRKSQSQHARTTASSSFFPHIGSFSRMRSL